MSIYYSQCQQDKFLEENFFKGFKNGFFMDIGAHDGIFINNTLYFEKNHNWNGINVEAIPEVFNKLVLNRPNCININCAVTNFNGESEFICNSGYTEMISGLKNNYDVRHSTRLINEINLYKGETKIISVETRTVDSILHETNVKHIHYLSIDVEGAEFDVIKSINFDNVFIDIIDFENNYEDTSKPIINYLQEKGYSVIKHYTDIIMIHKNSQFKIV
jgi:FkbM family methyltransferase